MVIYKIKNSTRCWDGESIGILILDAHYPCIPGNVGNATTFDFPVRYKKVNGASIDRLLNQRDPSLVKPFVEAALELESEGVRAVTGACGFMALFQEEVAAALRIPVFLSSLLQVPFIRRILNPSLKIGIITANASCLTEKHFRAVGVDTCEDIVIRGMEEMEEFRTAILEEKGTLDSEKIEQEVVEVAKNLVEEHPEAGAILLECSDLPPYAKAVQEATGRPVFDFITMIRFVHTAVVQQSYEGMS